MLPLPIYQTDDPEDLLDRFLSLLDELGISYAESCPPSSLDTPSLLTYYEVWIDTEDLNEENDDDDEV